MAGTDTAPPKVQGLYGGFPHVRAIMKSGTRERRAGAAGGWREDAPEFAQYLRRVDEDEKTTRASSDLHDFP